ncbi:hypothetical protein ACFL6S_06770 [Candidatus Poribacteria bacterium]
MNLHQAELISDLEIPVGETIALESLRQSVVPPYLMLMPFVEVPAEIVVEGQDSLEEDGVHGCVYQLRAETPWEGEITIGFRDIQTGKTTHSKVLRVTAR